jgi:PEP-CTERM motif
MRIHTLAAAVALAVSALGAQADTLDFDTGSSGAVVGTFYPGLTFSGASFTSNFGLAGSSGVLGIVSTSNFYHWTSSTPITIAFDTAASAFGIGVVDLGDNGFTIEAYDAANQLLGSSTTFGPSLGVGYYEVVSVAYDGIASVRMFQASGASGDGIVLDNLSYSVGAVPEPGTYALMALGLAGMAFVARRRKA